MQKPAGESLGPFPATEWSLVDRARRKDGSGFREALSMLLRRYLPALRAHLIVEKRFPLQSAEDLLQGFVTDKIIEQNLFEHAEKSRGKFRSFLLATLNHYIISQHRADSAAKRSPKEGLTELDERARLMSPGHDPSAQFNVAWARQFIREALDDDSVGTSQLRTLSPRRFKVDAQGCVSG
jgi:RNA polymerase sigma-70 factor (ECF subfamily)